MFRSLLLCALLAVPTTAFAGDEAAEDEAPPAEDEAPPAGDGEETAPADEGEEAPAEEPPVEEAPAEEAPAEEAPAEEAPAPPPPADEPPLPPARVKPAAPAPPTFKAMVQERARIEYVSNKDFVGAPAGRFKIGNRARAGLGMSLGPVKAFVQVQDVRTWGSEVNAANGGEGTLFDFSANNFDMHQAYGEIHTPFGLWFRIGRQEVNWHGQRLIGAVGWTDQARSFDGVRMVYEGENAGAEFFYALLLDRPIAGDTTTDAWDDVHVLSVRGGPRLGKALKLDAMAIVRMDDLLPERLATVGVHATGVVGPFSYEGEGYFQGGVRGTTTVAAFLVGLRAGATLHKGSGFYIGGGLDLVSGDDDPTDNFVGTFDTLYATNHKFYGHLDRYLNLPVHTGGQGLIDGLFRIKLAPQGKVVVLNDLHVFGSMNAPDGTDGFHGVEWDLNATFKVLPGFTVGTGVWTYFPGSWSGEGATPELGSYLLTNFLLK